MASVSSYFVSTEKVILNEALINVNDLASPSISYTFIVEIDQSGIWVSARFILPQKKMLICWAHLGSIDIVACFFMGYGIRKIYRYICYPIILHRQFMFIEKKIDRFACHHCDVNWKEAFEQDKMRRRNFNFFFCNIPIGSEQG